MSDVPASTVLFVNILLGTFSGATVILTILFVVKEIYDLIQDHHGLKGELKKTAEQLQATKEKCQKLERENGDLERDNHELKSDVEPREFRKGLYSH